MENQLPDGSGAVALFEGDGGNFTGIAAGEEMEEMIDVIVYDNMPEGEASTANLVVMMDLCGAFGQADGCAAMDSGDDSSIQVDDEGNVGSGVPTPGAENMIALPVELTSFTGFAPKTNTVELTWVTERETANAGFTVQHHRAGRWAELTWVTGAGDSDLRLTYSSTLGDIPTGQQLFRLRQEDFDGTISYSNVLPITVAGGQAASIFPNPTAGPLTVLLAKAIAGEYQMTLIDASGRTLSRQRTDLRVDGPLRLELDLTGRPTAPYYVRVVGPTGVTTLPINKQ